MNFIKSSFFSININKKIDRKKRNPSKRFDELYRVFSAFTRLISGHDGDNQTAN